jgi:outer membrane lipoprotein-sorting protein
MICSALLVPSWGFALTGSEIIRKSEEAVRGNTQTATYIVTIKTKRWTRSMKLKAWDDRTKKRSFSEVISPKKDAGNRFLLIDKTMKHFVPKLQQEITISPSMMMQSWMGSDFTNDDIVKESSIIEDYTHKLSGSKNVEGHECHVVELIPKPDAAVVWGKIMYYARKSDYLPVRQEYFSERGDLKRVMNFSNFKKIHDRVIPTFYKMETAGKDDRFTSMEIIDAKFNINIPASVFTLQNLKRR